MSTSLVASRMAAVQEVLPTLLPISCLNRAYPAYILPTSCLNAAYPAYILPISYLNRAYPAYILPISCLNRAYPAYILPRVRSAESCWLGSR